jgi:hypothetical protein
MREKRSPIPVKLFIGMLSPEPELFDVCADIVCKEYGPIDYQSEIVPWTNSDFYKKEMGSGMLRKFIFFEQLRDPGDLPAIKLNTIRIESDFAIQTVKKARRRINLDPGYVTEAKVVLATTKDYTHRLYIGEGIYAEVTLRFNNKDRSFTPFDYSYLDYRSETYKITFNKARALLRTTLKRPAGKRL